MTLLHDIDEKLDEIICSDDLESARDAAYEIRALIADASEAGSETEELARPI